MEVQLKFHVLSDRVIVTTTSTLQLVEGTE